MTTTLLRWVAPCAIVCSLLAAFAVWKVAFPAPTSAATEVFEEPRLRVELTEGKQDAAGIRTEKCRRQEMQEHRLISGRITYDESRHVTVRSPVNAVVQQVVVKPGSVVTTGDLLAVLSSSAIGDARSDVLKREAELSLALRQTEWEDQVTANVESLVTSLKERPELAMLEQSFEKKVLGDYREKVFTAYSKFLLAEALSNKLKPLADQGVAEGRVLRERTSNREVTESAFRAACEQAVFDARQKRDLCRGSAEDARRRLQVARHHLATLLGREEEKITTDPASLSLLELRAAFSGTVEERLTARAERVTQADPLFILADISKLWVEGDIREKDWDVMTLEPGDVVQVQVPALSNRDFKAIVNYMGRTVSETSHALPLVAEIDNEDRQLRPGMFVRISVPTGQSHEGIAVPESALMEHDRQQFVFVEEKPGVYRRTEVAVGRKSPGLVEVTSGLKGGESVVVAGAYTLKSELLLEAEE